MDLLDSYLNGFSEPEFDWSKNNCGHFAAGWVKMTEGVDRLNGVVFPEKHEDIVDMIIHSYGSMLDMISKLMGRYPISPSFAVRGDLVFSPTPSGCGGMLGICNGSTAVFLREGSGIVALRMRVATHAWRVNQ